MKKPFPIVVRGGGDLATGTIHKLYQAGFPVIVLETTNPSAIRRYVAFSEAVYEGEWTVEGVTAVWAADFAEAQEILEDGKIPVLIDPDCKILEEIQPQVLVDAILAKKNLGTTMDMAETVIALGPGFTAGVDAHLVIETQRGHNLGRVLTEGFKIADIDPRESEQKNCYTISDKARCIAGGVLEGILMRNRGSFIWKK